MAMDMIDISVVITVYNIEKYIGECLESVLAQKEKNIEVICVDDASTDCSLDVLRKYAARDERILVIANQVNQGAGSSRNVGCRAAKGKYLYIIDGDDLLVEGSLKKLFDIAESNHLDILTFEGEAFWDEDLEYTGHKNQMYQRKGSYHGIYKGAVIFSEFIKNHDTTGNTYLNFINREFFVNNELFWTEGVRYNSDSVFAIFMAAERVMRISDVLYRRRYRTESIVTSPMKGIYLPGMIIQFLRELDIWDMHGSISVETDEGIEEYFRTMHADINKVYHLTIDEQEDHEGRLLSASKKAQYFYRYCVKKQPLFVDCIANEDLERIKAADKIVIYGIGRYGSLVAEILEYHGINDYEVAVSKVREKENSFRGKKINNISDIKLHNDKTLVIVAVGKRLREEMVESLENIGCGNFVVCRDRDF